MRTVYGVCEGLFSPAMRLFAYGGKIGIRFLQTQFTRLHAVKTDESTGEIGHQRIAAFLRHLVDGDIAVVEEQEPRFLHPHLRQVRLRREGERLVHAPLERARTDMHTPGYRLHIRIALLHLLVYHGGQFCQKSLVVVRQVGPVRQTLYRQIPVLAADLLIAVLERMDALLVVLRLAAAATVRDPCADTKHRRDHRQHGSRDEKRLFLPLRPLALLLQEVVMIDGVIAADGLGGLFLVDRVAEPRRPLQMQHCLVGGGGFEHLIQALARMTLVILSRWAKKSSAALR